MKKILAVDDDVDFLEELGTALEIYDYQVITNPDPVDAVRHAREVKPDCILFDLRMPGKHGFQFSEALKEDPELKRIPSIAMSGHYSDDYEMYLSIFGINKFLKKPFSPNDAMGMIQSTLKDK